MYPFILLIPILFMSIAENGAEVRHLVCESLVIVDRKYAQLAAQRYRYRHRYELAVVGEGRSEIASSNEYAELYVRELFGKVNDIYSKHLFGDYGIQFSITDIQVFKPIKLNNSLNFKFN